MDVQQCVDRQSSAGPAEHVRGSWYLFLSTRRRKPRASSDRFPCPCPLSQILPLCQDFDPNTHTHTTKLSTEIFV